jgi:hypothetical protein
MPEIQDRKGFTVLPVYALYILKAVVVDFLRHMYQEWKWINFLGPFSGRRSSKDAGKIA